jgi:hypothetical protein
MEIGQQTIDRVKLVRRMNKNISRAILRDEATVLPDGRLEHANRCGTNGKNLLCGIDRSRCLARDGEALGVHAMPGNGFTLDWPKRSRADMQGNENVRQPREDFRGKMQTSSRRRNRTRLLRKDGLVPRRVLRVGGAIEIRRERNLPGAIRIDRAVEAYDAIAVVVDFFHLASRPIEHHGRGETHLLSRFHETSPSQCIELFEKQKFDCPVIGEAARRQDAGIIQYKKIALPNERGQFEKVPMLNRAACAIEHHHSRIFPPREGTLGNQFIRQIEVVIFNAAAHLGEGSSSFQLPRRRMPAASLRYDRGMITQKR